MPSGARKVARCFSTANMKIVKTSRDVRNISIKSPWDLLVLPLSVVVTARGARDDRLHHEGGGNRTEKLRWDDEESSSE